MQQNNGSVAAIKESIVIGSIKLQEIPYKVKSPIFEDVIVKVPVFQNEPIKVPVGFDTIVNQLALDITNAVLKQVESIVREKLDKAIDERISTIRVPKVVEDLVIKNKEVEVERVLYRDVEVQRPKFVDKEVINPVLINKEVVNAVVIDKTVVNAIIKDVNLTNAIIKDVEVDRAIIREKVIDVIHPRYLKLNGEPE